MSKLHLAHLRNSLANRKFSDEEQLLLKNIRSRILGSNTPFKSIILTSLDNCISDIEKDDFESAAREIDLIHNFPTTVGDIPKWDENHFYRIELLSYIELAKSVERLKSLILMLAEAQQEIQKTR